MTTLATQHSPPSQRYMTVLLLALFGFVWFCNLGYRSLVRPDEGRYAEIAREMATSGDWVTPRLNGIKYFEKPPLQYWMTAASYEAFGQHEWTARLWTALCGFFCVLLTAFTGRHLLGARAGLFAGVVLASSLLFAAIGHINTLDMGVTFCLTLGVFGFLLAQRSDNAPREKRVWMWLAWAAMGLAFLSKGLIGLVLPGAALVLYALIERDLSFVRRLEWIPGIALMLIITLPWLIAVSIANPEFPRFFFIHEHFERFLTQAHHRTAPGWYFVPILAAGLLPWTPMFVQSVIGAWKRDAAQPPLRPRRFLLIYSAVIFLFFSVSQSKLPSYILPIFPALALLLGEWLAQVRGRKLAWLIAPVALLALAGALTSPLMAHLGGEKVPAALYAIFSKWILAAALILLVAAVVAIVLAWRERIDAALIALGAGGLLFLQIGMTGHESLSPSYSTAHLVGLLRPLASPDTPFYSVRTYEQTLPFYIKRTVTLVDYRDELDFGLQQEPQREIATVEEFEMRWRNDPKALAIMGPDVYQELAGRGLPMRLLYEDARRVIVSKP